MKWPTTTIQTPNGEQQAIAPLVISASRATDIPAFHSRWFMERLNAGYCVWVNPFNRSTKQYISFSQCKVIVFWSKNPSPLMQHLEEIADRGFQFYFQFTLNDYVVERLEPYVSSLESRIETFRKLSEMIGKEKIIWRFDPIILGESITVECILEKIRRLWQQLSQHTEKLVFSFAEVDCYKKVQNNLRKNNLYLRKPSSTEMIAIAEGIAKLNTVSTYPLVLASCAEKIDLSAYGIEHNKCMDDKLILRLCKGDSAIFNFYKRPEQQKLPVDLVNKPLTRARLKDPGQRRECGCVASKDIGAYGTCPHMCAYCYANPAETIVASNMARLKAGSESLL